MGQSINTVAQNVSSGARNQTDWQPEWQVSLAPEYDSNIELVHGAEPVQITWGVAQWAHGDCLLAVSPIGICGCDIGDFDAKLKSMDSSWRGAHCTRDDKHVQAHLNEAIATLQAGEKLALHSVGTGFQVQVWRALLQIRPGHVMTYGQVAAGIGRPGAARAVGTAIGANRIAIFVPCHRVVPTAGGVGDYRWGSDLKQKLLTNERDSGSGCASSIG